VAGKEIIRTERAPAPFQGAPYSQATRFGDFVFTAGQLGLDPATGSLVEGGIEEQTSQALDNLEAILEEAGSSLANALKVSIFLADLGDFEGLNAVYGARVGDRPPARTTIEAARLPSGALVEIDAVAHV
jgi:2-iminobutanoate/2-iminopropanoate deaminase